MKSTSIKIVITIFIFLSISATAQLNTMRQKMASPTATQVAQSFVKEGTYFLRITETGKYCGIEGVSTNNGARLVQWDFANQDNHKFYISKTPDGYYLIKAIHSNRYLNVAGQSLDDGAIICQWDYVNQDNLKWSFYYHKANNSYTIKNKQSNKELKLQTKINDPVNGVVLTINGNVGNQTFMLQEVNASNYLPSKTQNKTEKLSSALSGNYSLNVNGLKYSIKGNGAGQLHTLKSANPFIGQKIKPSSKPDLEEDEEVLPDGRIKKCVTTFETLDINNFEIGTLSREVMDNIKPGIVYDLQDVQEKGKFLSFKNEKSPFVVRLNAANVRQPAIKIDNPNDEVEFGNALGTLLNQQSSAAPLGIEESKFSQIRNETEFKMSLGLGFGSPFVDVNTLFNMSSSNKKEKFLFEYRWLGFTLETLPNAAGLFTSQEMNNKGSLVYVDKITYGTRILVSFELEEGSQSFANKTSIDASYGVYSANADLDFSNSSKFKDVKFKMIAWGVTQGSSGTVITANGADDLRYKLGQMISNLKNVALYPSAWGVPISYSLKFLNGAVAVASAKLDELPRRLCTISDAIQKKTISIQINSIAANPNEDCDMYGGVWVELFDGNNNKIAETFGRNDLIYIDKKAHLKSSMMYGDPAGSKGPVFNAINEFKMQSNLHKLEGAYFKIWSWVNDDDDSGDDVMQLQNGNRTLGSRGNHWMQKVYIDWNVKPSQQQTFKQNYSEGGDGCSIDYAIKLASF